MLGIKVARHEDGKTAAQAGRQVRGNKGTGGLHVSRQYFHLFRSQPDVDSGSFEVLQALNGYSLMNYTAPDQYCCSASFG
jgi:hypothetical protein